MDTKTVGSFNKIHGSKENIPYDLFWPKELDYIIKIMYTYGSLLVSPGQKELTRVWEDMDTGEDNKNKLNFHDPFYYIFFYRITIDDHKNYITLTPLQRKHGLPTGGIIGYSILFLKRIRQIATLQWNTGCGLIITTLYSTSTIKILIFPSIENERL